MSLRSTSPILQGKSGDGARQPPNPGPQGHSMCKERAICTARTACLCSSTLLNKWDYMSLSACEYKHRCRCAYEHAVSCPLMVMHTQAHLCIHRYTHSPHTSQPNASSCRSALVKQLAREEKRSQGKREVQPL